jgi:uncharacterized damage-inducible protein DinB
MLRATQPEAIVPAWRLTTFVAHEGHHWGQIVLVARQLGHRLPAEVSGRLW